MTLTTDKGISIQWKNTPLDNDQSLYGPEILGPHNDVGKIVRSLSGPETPGTAKTPLFLFLATVLVFALFFFFFFFFGLVDKYLLNTHFPGERTDCAKSL